MKHAIIFCYLLIVVSGSIMCQVIISDALLNNGEMVTLKRRFVNASNILHKTSFGSFTTVDINKGKQHFVGRQNDPYLEIKGRNASMKRNVTKINSQSFSLIILQDGVDTIISNMDIFTKKGVDRALIEVGKNNVTEESSINTCEDMVIEIKGDSLNWHLPQTIDKSSDPDFPFSFDGLLTNGIDNIQLKGAGGFPVKRKVFENSAKGIVFLFNKKQIAALETYPETSIWFANNINGHHKQVIAAVIISILSLSASEMR